MAKSLISVCNRDRGCMGLSKLSPEKRQDAIERLKEKQKNNHGNEVSRNELCQNICGVLPELADKIAAKGLGELVTGVKVVQGGKSLDAALALKEDVPVILTPRRIDAA